MTHISHKSNDLGLSTKPDFRVYCKAEFHLTIREGSAVLAPSHPSDPFQKWCKDEKYSTIVKDKDGHPSFALVNKATGQAIKHSVGDGYLVQLVPYNPNMLDLSVLWTESQDIRDGYRAVRAVNNTHLNLDAFHGDEASGGVRDGITIALWKWNAGDNQLWKIFRNCKLRL